MAFADFFGEPPAPARRRSSRPKLLSNFMLEAAIVTVQPFVPPSQLATMLDGMDGPEGKHFEAKIYDLSNTLIAMPDTYGQENFGDQAIVHLHYFMGGMDWHITEQDREGCGTARAFGLANLGHGAELGYISIEELCTIRGMQLDLYWTPKTLQAVKAGA